MRPRIGPWLVAAAVSLTGCAGSAAPGSAPSPVAHRSAGLPDPAPLAVMTFNIRYGTANDGENAWPLRRDVLLGVLRDAAPDVVGLQEALRGQLDEIRAALPAYGEAGVGRDDGRTAGEYAAILFRTDRFVLAEAGDFWFSDTPEVPGSRSWGNNVTRLCTYVRLADRATGRPFYLYNVHLDHESQPSRERSAALLLERIRRRDHPDPVLVTGDFNAGEDNPAVRAMARDAFVDTFNALHAGDADVNTYHAFRGTTAGARIDFVFASPGWVVLESAIVRTARDGRYPSDHFPVSARLAWPGGGGSSRR